MKRIQTYIINIYFYRIFNEQIQKDPNWTGIYITTIYVNNTKHSLSNIITIKIKTLNLMNPFNKNLERKKEKSQIFTPNPILNKLI